MSTDETPQDVVTEEETTPVDPYQSVLAKLIHVLRGRPLSHEQADTFLSELNGETPSEPVDPYAEKTIGDLKILAKNGDQTALARLFERV